MSTLYSKVRIAGHPVHPMLVAFPVAFYTATLLGFAIYAATGELFWWRLGVVSNAAGVLGAALAAIPGFIDWATGIPNGSAAKKTGLIHMFLNVGALALFIVNLVAQSNRWQDVVRLMRTTGQLDTPNPGLALVLSALGVLLTIGAGFFGWKLVQTHHVGVDLSDEQRQLESPQLEPHGPQARHGRTLA